MCLHKAAVISAANDVFSRSVKQVRKYACLQICTMDEWESLQEACEVRPNSGESKQLCT